jgi:hypothetical protein
MKILLINTNPVVSRLVSLCTEDESIVLEEVDHISKTSGTAYDLAFVDDEAYSDEVAAFLGWVAQVGKVVYFSGRDSGEEIGDKFDIVLKKPFLPSHIQEIISQTEVMESVPEQKEKEVSEKISETEENTAAEPQEGASISPLASENEVILQDEAGEDDRADEAETKVLDTKEIAQIKALLEEEDEEITPVDPSDEKAYEARKIAVITQKLEEEGLEIVPEEEIIASLGKEKKKRKKHAKMKKKKAKKSKENIYTFEETLLAAIENMKPKKIKKLLKGAEVTIKIRFEDEK